MDNESTASILDISNIPLEGDFDMQVQLLLAVIRLTRAEVENLEGLVADLTATFSKTWPGCKIYPFGSIVMGLGIRTSDIDCYVSLPNWVKLQPNHIISKARHMLMAQSEKYAKVTAIFARVPIVKFCYLPTTTHCDVNFKSLAGVQNSRLLAYLVRVDPRVLPLAIIIKYWSKVHHLTGTNLLPNYSLTLMIVFYLQHVNILPPVHLLQHPQNQYMVDGWNTGFNEIEFNNTDHLTIYHLIGGFFDYYANFEFDTYVVCPYLGCQIRKDCFGTLGHVPKEFALYKMNVINSTCRPFVTDVEMCIQDPFEHCRNCSIAVRGRLFERLINTCKRAAKCFYDSKEEDFLKDILTRVPTESSSTAKPRKVEKHKNRHPLHSNITKNIRHIYNDYKKNRHK